MEGLLPSCFVLILVLGCHSPAVSANLAKVFSKPLPAYSWNAANTQTKDPLMTPIFNILKAYKIPSATMGYRLNPKNNIVYQVSPGRGQWHDPEFWWMAGFGINYTSPLRVASVTKPLTEAVWTTFLGNRLEDFFYRLWTRRIGSLPEPKDPRVKQIKIKHLLAHTSGFDNGMLGYDPAFQGIPVKSQIGQILQSTMLLTTPGQTFSYNNLGFMILAELAEAIQGKSFTNQMRELFPTAVPVYGADDTVPASAAALGLASEPSTYVILSPDRAFSAAPMKGNGNLVSNVATLTWFGTKYWMGGNNAGHRIDATNLIPGQTWIMNGAMPGTMSFLVQWTTPKLRVSSICIIINTRISPADGRDAFYTALNNAAAKFLQDKFKDF